MSSKKFTPEMFNRDSLSENSNKKSPTTTPFCNLEKTIFKILLA